MFYNLGPRDSIHLTNVKRLNSSFLKIFFRLGWKTNNICFIAVYHFSQHFLNIDINYLINVAQ